ncbi:MAG TPA: hypothetical protein VMW56_29335, partial [Candidatus Margulisiibacteriota bacterium]|nr:hypothetical protein [Candidatus Margulisiibacteriota bacterium]
RNVRRRRLAIPAAGIQPHSRASATASRHGRRATAGVPAGKTLQPLAVALERAQVAVGAVSVGVALGAAVGVVLVAVVVVDAGADGSGVNY